jgi:UDPglucose 6-dehydrogenase
MNKIAVIGSGYVGLVTGTCFSEMGNEVVCVDIDEAKVETMKNGKIPIYEPHLDVLFERNIKQGRLTFSTDLAASIKDCEVIFLALPTPPGGDGSADLSYVLGVAEEIGKLLIGYKILVDKSTVPVGTAEKVKEKVRLNYSGDFDVVSNPEFLREGFAVDDFMKPDRVVLGVSSSKAEKIMGDLYKPFVRSGNPIIFMDEKSAELTKYAANSFLATKISFMNEIANLCELVGADVDMVRKGIGSDDRIGKRFLFPGIGYGGSCFPKDVQALVKSSNDVGYKLEILDSVMKVNQNQKKRLIQKITTHFNGSIENKKVAIWGLAFKPDTDDIREAPALEMISELLDHNCEISVFDPEAMNNVRNLFSEQIEFSDSMYSALDGKDFLIIATEWGVFRNPDFNKLKAKLNSPLIFDGRNMYEHEFMSEKGFTYYSIGRS